MGIMVMTVNALKSQAFKLKGRLYTFTVMQLLEGDYASFANQLDDVVNKAPRLFDKTPLVLDCSAVDGDKLDLQTICQCLREHGILPIGIQGGTPLLETLAQCQGLAVLNASSAHDKPTPKKTKETKQNTINTKLLTAPVRSGQQVVSMGGDLIIAAAVSHGAELLSDGNIHVYGALRGRALAGIAGNKQARIFCQSLDAELVSIAGFYLLSDAMDPVAKPCQIFLQDDQIQIEPL
jgi:septum site-determining protein MinC